MFRSIKLTKFEEVLIDSRDSDRTEESKLGDCIGVHAICGGNMYICRVSLTHKAIFCIYCQLRIIIPAEIVTYADLRKHLSEDNMASVQLVSARSGN